jgi:hypothetical protein
MCFSIDREYLGLFVSLFGGGGGSGSKDSICYNCAGIIVSKIEQEYPETLNEAS